MTREEAKKILGENATEEQVSNLLNSYHNSMKTKEAELKQAQETLAKYSDYDALKNQLDEINKAKMTEQEKLEADKKTAEENLKQSRIILNKAKAKEVLSGYDIDDELINSLVNDDETLTLKNANLLKTKMDTFKDSVTKEVQSQITSLDVKPTPTNIPQKDDAMTLDKFSNLSAEEQNKFMEEHPEEFENL